MIEAFASIQAEEPRILILGSVPSVKSLEKAEYYGHERNAFWPIMDKLYNQGRGFSSYQDKKELIRANNLALWDVVGRCERKGSLDSAIKDVVPHDLQSYLLAYQTIEKILFNGKASALIYKREIGYYPKSIEFCVMPSTSPAYTISFNKKYELWQKKLTLSKGNKALVND